jgi:hypothetical protein
MQCANAATVNGSDSKVGLKRDEHFATIEFLVTNKVTAGYEQEHQDQNKLGQFMQSSVAVKPGGTILDQLNDLKGEWKTFRNVFMVAGLALFVGSAALICALGKWAYETAEKADGAAKSVDDLLKRVEQRTPASPSGSNSQNIGTSPKPANASSNQPSPQRTP